MLALPFPALALISYTSHQKHRVWRQNTSHGIPTKGKWRHLLGKRSCTALLFSPINYHNNI